MSRAESLATGRGELAVRDHQVGGSGKGLRSAGDFQGDSCGDRETRDRRASVVAHVEKADARPVRVVHALVPPALPT